jgi:hypothetical protein
MLKAHDLEKLGSVGGTLMYTQSDADGRDSAEIEQKTPNL